MTKVFSTLYRFIHGFTVVAAVIATGSQTLLPTPVVAQSCGSCSGTGDGRHVAIDEVGPGLDDGLGDGWHEKPRVGSCLLIHGVCGGGGDGEMASVGDIAALAPLLLVADVVAAVLDEDVGRLAEFASRSSVRIVPQRMALQVVGCGGAIVGHVPVEAELLEAVAIALDGP